MTRESGLFRDRPSLGDDREAKVAQGPAGATNGLLPFLGNASHTWRIQDGGFVVCPTSGV